MSDTPEYRQTRCDHGWVDQSQCRQCAVVRERDALRARVKQAEATLDSLREALTMVQIDRPSVPSDGALEAECLDPTCPTCLAWAEIYATVKRKG